jgi:hypothetical protein
MEVTRPPNELISPTLSSGLVGTYKGLWGSVSEAESQATQPWVVLSIAVFGPGLGGG